MRKLKTGDKVVVVSGSNKGKEGKILKVLENKVLVEGVNIVKKHSKPRTTEEQGGIVEVEAPIHVSNVKVVGDKKVKEAKTKAVKETAKKESK